LGFAPIPSSVNAHELLKQRSRCPSSSEVSFTHPGSEFGLRLRFQPGGLTGQKVEPPARRDCPAVKFIICALMGKNPSDRVKTLLGRLHSISISKKRGSKASKKADLLFNKFIKQVEKNFKYLPKPLEWQSFYVNDLPLLMDICKEVQEVSIQHRPWPRAGM